MRATDKAVARLARRKIEGKFGGDSTSSLVRVTCLERDEIVALVADLRDWSPPGGGSVRVVVTTRTTWEGLSDRDVLATDETPTTLRNLRDVSVVLIEGDSFTDRQSWQSVAAISDATLLDGPGLRRDLIEEMWRVEPPELLVQILEEVHQAVRPEGEEHAPVRGWITFVERVADRLRGSPTVDAATVWGAIGPALPSVRLFPDDLLPSLSETDRRRRLRKNLADSHKLLFEADDRWRDDLLDRVPAVVFEDLNGNPEPDQADIAKSMRQLLGPEGGERLGTVSFRHWLQVVDRSRDRRGLGTRIREDLALVHPGRLDEFDDLDVTGGIDAGNADDAQSLLDELPKVEDDPPLVSLLSKRQVAALERMANPRVAATRAPLAELLLAVSAMASERLALFENLGEDDSAILVVEPWKERTEAVHSRALFAWLFGPTLASVQSEVAQEAWGPGDPRVPHGSSCARRLREGGTLGGGGR